MEDQSASVHGHKMKKDYGRDDIQKVLATTIGREELVPQHINTEQEIRPVTSDH